MVNRNTGSDKPHLPLTSAYPFAEQRGLSKEVDEIKKTPHAWSGLRRALIAELFSDRGILEQFIAECWTYGATLGGQKYLNRYKNRLVTWREETDDSYIDEDIEDDYESQTTDGEFPPVTLLVDREIQLQRYLSDNLDVIEPGLVLYFDGEMTGIEYPLGENGGLIDLVGVDSNGEIVIIELKKGPAREGVLGQLFRYMAGMQSNLPSGTKIRGIIVAGKITENLELAASIHPNVKLFEYGLEINMTEI